MIFYFKLKTERVRREESDKTDDRGRLTGVVWSALLTLVFSF